MQVCALKPVSSRSVHFIQIYSLSPAKSIIYPLKPRRNAIRNKATYCGSLSSEYFKSLRRVIPPVSYMGPSEALMHEAIQSLHMRDHPQL